MSERLTTKPNIIFIVADDLGYGDLGCYGQPVIQTPHLDTLAAEGMRFTDCYAASTVCAPSRWCLMTGLHTGHAHTAANKALLYPEDLTVADILKSAGYTTAGIGKWAMGNPGTTGLPGLQSFDQWFGYLDQGHAHTYYPVFLWRNDTMHWLRANFECRKAVYSHDLLTEEALQFILGNQAYPFFLYLAYTIPHANNELFSITGNGMEIPSDAPYSDEDWPQVEKSFAAMVTRLDRDIGMLVKLLQECGLDDNTIIFFTSDNGPHEEGGHQVGFFGSAGPLRGWKRSLYEGGIRVPMLVRWPDVISPGSISDHAWAFWDVLPTLADLAGVEAPANIDGQSIVPTLLGQTQQDHEYLYWSYLQDNILSQAVRMEHWKGVRNQPSDNIELYDLRRDIGETKNLAAQYPETIADMGQIMIDFGEAHHTYLPTISSRW
jgi:arylsulfatase A-like enzyme